MSETNDFLLKNFKNVLDQVGHDISAEKYDKLDLPLKPARTTLRKRFEASWVELKAMVVPDKTVITHKHLIDQNKNLFRRLEAERNRTEAILSSCFAAMDKMEFKPIPAPKKELAKENLEHHLMRSDAHVGALISPEWVQGLSSYNTGIYKDRIEELANKVMLFREQDKASLGLNKLVLYYLGDQLEGEMIFSGQAYQIDMLLIDQLFTSVDIESNFILSLASVFPEIEIFCVIGNHGRVGKKNEHSKRTNMDYIFYRLLQERLRRQENVAIYVSKSPTMLVKNGDFVFALNHGDTSKSWNGIPYYGLDRSFRKLTQLYNMVISYFLCGHFHNPANLSDNILINGCIPGGSDLSINSMLVSSRPSQKQFYFHPKHGVNRESNLCLAKTPELTPDDNGIFTYYD